MNKQCETKIVKNRNIIISCFFLIISLVIIGLSSYYI